MCLRRFYKTYLLLSPVCLIREASQIQWIRSCVSPLLCMQAHTCAKTYLRLKPYFRTQFSLLLGSMEFLGPNSVGKNTSPLCGYIKDCYSGFVPSSGNQCSGSGTWVDLP